MAVVVLKKMSAKVPPSSTFVIFMEPSSTYVITLEFDDEHSFTGWPDEFNGTTPRSIFRVSPMVSPELREIDGELSELALRRRHSGLALFDDLGGLGRRIAKKQVRS